MAVSPSLIAEAVGWRREFHAAPELGYQEQETSRRVAELLASFGLQVHRGLAGTGVVATLENVISRSNVCVSLCSAFSAPVSKLLRPAIFRRPVSRSRRLHCRCCVN